MGVNHLMSIGTSLGAVTSSLAYLLHHEREYLAESEGSIVESVVLFCSPDVRQGDTKADESIRNEYGKTKAGRTWSNTSLREVLADFLPTSEIGQRMRDERAKLYIWPVDVTDYDRCFEAVVKTTLSLARADDTGKRLWANITGGTNVLNAALMQTASLSGLVDRIYYVFLANNDDRKYLNPSSERADRFRVSFIPRVKTAYDERYYLILDKLASLPEGEWITGEQLFKQLRSDPSTSDWMGKMEWSHFRNQYLNRMAGTNDDCVIEEQDKSEFERLIRINARGQKVWEYVYCNELIEALTHRETRNPELVQQCKRELESWTVQLT